MSLDTAHAINAMLLGNIRMCRMVAALSVSPRTMGSALVEAPRSLFALSSEHPHGWGVGQHDGQQWRCQLGLHTAHADSAYRHACEGETHAWIAHVRLATVGVINLENTHPFVRGRWCFAHNGTIKDQDFLLANTSAARLTQRSGTTDSELFLSYLLSHLDHEGMANQAPDAAIERVLLRALDAAISRPEFGAINFMLSDGETLFVHRFGRSLSFRADESQFVAASEPWSDTDPWHTLDDGALLRVDRHDGRITHRVL
ncbi:MAG: class II glutamine amidotransferase [Deltaproteobacteria bacterium]|nr:class II glutamine amidotransferase [Deltaproteobacteria bacterium]